MVCLFHVAKEDSGTRMIKRQETKFWSSSGEPSSGGKLKDQILVPKTKFWLVNKWMRMDVSTTHVKSSRVPKPPPCGSSTSARPARPCGTWVSVVILDQHGGVSIIFKIALDGNFRTEEREKPTHLKEKTNKKLPGLHNTTER